MAATLSPSKPAVRRGRSRAAVGAAVTLYDMQDKTEWTVRIVETENADPDEDRISDECPLGAAVLGRAAGEVISIEAPSGVLRYRVLSVA